MNYYLPSFLLIVGVTRVYMATIQQSICPCWTFGTPDSSCIKRTKDYFNHTKKEPNIDCFDKLLKKYNPLDLFFAKETDVPVTCENNADSILEKAIYAPELDKENVSSIAELSEEACENLEHTPHSRADIHLDLTVMESVFIYRNSSFDISVEIKIIDTISDYAEQWNSCTEHEPFNNLQSDLWLEFKIRYWGNSYVSVTYERSAVETLLPGIFFEFPNQRITSTGKIFSIFLHRNSTATLGLKFFCCFPGTGAPGFIGTLFPNFLKKVLSQGEFKPLPPKNLTVKEIRGFSNSCTQFTLSWNCPSMWNGIPKSYQLMCKVYDPTHPLFLDPSCIMCSVDMRYCDTCWQNTHFPSLITGPYTYREVPWTEHSHSFTVQTNLNNVFKNTSFHRGKMEKEQSDVSTTVPIFKFDWHFAFMPNTGTLDSLKMDRESLRDSIVLPGPHSWPTALRSDEIQFLFALCGVRGKLASGTVGEWSSLTRVSFADHKQSAKLLAYVVSWDALGDTAAPYMTDRWCIYRKQLCSGTLAPQQVKLLQFDKPSNSFLAQDLTYKKPALFGWGQKGLAVVAENPTKSTNFQLELSKVGCYHWMLDSWYAFIKNPQSGKHTLSFHLGDTGSLYFEELDWKFLFETDGIPQHAHCVHLHNYVLWSELDNKGTIRIYQVQLSQQHLSQVAAKPILLTNDVLCSCELGSFVSSTSFDVLYESMSNFDVPNLILACGQSICNYKINGDQFHSNHIADIPTNLGTIVTVASDQEQLYLQLRNSTSIHIYSMTTNKWSAVNSLKRRVNIDLNQQEAYSGFKSFYFKQEMKFDGVRISAHRCAPSLPIPPTSCVFPKMSMFHLKMISTASIEVEMSQAWSQEHACQGVARPAAIFRVRYAVILDKNNTREIESPSAYNCSILSCLEKKTNPTREKSITMEFGGFIVDKVYYFEAAVIPALHKSVKLSWYAGQEYHSLEKVYKTHYEKDKTAMAGIGLALILIVVAIALISVLIWMYNRTWYLYRSLKRLTTRDIKRKEQLGHGHYGEVWRATLFGREVIVVKALKESATNLEEKQFREEALLLSKLKSDNIVKSLGICLESKPMMLALEYMDGGSVDSYLSRNDVRNAIDGADLFLIIQDSAKACIYLSSGGYVHRDVAARNVLVTLDSRKSPKPKIAKLTDFGLAKDIGHSEIYRSDTPETNVLPTAWTAPEAFDGQFSPSSDVWSFGVLIWEVFTFGSVPFGKCNLNFNDHPCPLSSTPNSKIEAMIRLEDKTLLDFPPPCNAELSDDMKHILQWCFSSDPDERPSFTQLLKFIQKRKAKLCETKWDASHAVKIHTASEFPRKARNPLTTPAYTALAARELNKPEDSGSLRKSAVVYDVPDSKNVLSIEEMELS